MCGNNASLPLWPIKTLKIAAGSTIGFAAKGQSMNRRDESEDFTDVSLTTCPYVGERTLMGRYAVRSELLHVPQRSRDCVVVQSTRRRLE
jgi:hypothetical protein